MNNQILSFILKDSITLISFDEKKITNFGLNTEYGCIGLDNQHETKSIPFTLILMAALSLIIITVNPNNVERQLAVILK